LESEVLNGVFEKWWPDLEKEINEIMSRTSHASPPIRSEKDMVEEILNLTRGQVERLNKVEETLVTIQKTSRPRPSWTIGDAFQPTSIPGGFDTNALYRALLERDTKKDDEEKSKKQ
jgi:hypothetical protein